MISLDELALKAAKNRASHQLLVQKLKKREPSRFDESCKEIHDSIFEEINCLECANCCRGLGPRLSDRDIEKLSKKLRQKPSAFVAEYLRIDEDCDYVFKSMPCPFLGADNYCSVYSDLPKACAEYPHTDARKMVQLLPLALKNAPTCPAVFEFLERLKKLYL